MQQFNSNTEEKVKAINSLRDVLATLKYEIWETEPQLNRADISENEWEEYIAARFSEWPYFNLKYIEGLIFKPKNITEPKDAFAYLNHLQPTMENAFLFNNRLG